jgi:hypothetical protein
MTMTENDNGKAKFQRKQKETQKRLYNENRAYRSLLDFEKKEAKRIQLNEKNFKIDLNSTSRGPVPASSDLTPISGVLGRKRAAHLLRRTTFGFTYSDLQAFSDMTIDQALNLLLDTSLDQTFEPINNYTNSDNDEVGLGQPWGNDDYSGQDPFRGHSLQGYVAKRYNEDSPHIRAQLHMMLYGITVATSNSPNAFKRYFEIIWRYASRMDSYRDFIREISVSEAMLAFLNGALNRGDGSNRPDENFARELMELFTMGKDPLNGGQNFTESDVFEAAKLLTGFSIDYMGPQGSNNFIYRPEWHDTNDKIFSSTFNNTTIQGRSSPSGMDAELDELLNMIFSTTDAQEYLPRRIVRWFGFPEITQAVENNIVAPLSRTFLDNNFSIRHVLDQFLRSAYFFDNELRGAMIKNPLLHTLSFSRPFNLTPNDAGRTDEFSDFEFYFLLKGRPVNGKYSIGAPPNVAGWSQFYRPNYDIDWMTGVNSVDYYNNTNSISQLNTFAVASTLTGNFWRIAFNVFPLMLSTSNPGDPSSLINDTFSVLWAVNPSSSDVSTASTFLTQSGDTEYSWPQAVSNYQSDPGNMGFRQIVELRYLQAVNWILKHPNFSLY